MAFAQVGNLVIDRVKVGPIRTNCYIATLADGEGCVAFDPGENCGMIMDLLAGRKLDAIILTHRHYDHVNALADLVERTGATVYAHALDADAIIDPANNPADPVAAMYSKPGPVDHRVKDGDTITVGDIVFEVLHTPGHTIGSMSLLYRDGNGQPAVLFSGDTLFAGAYGRTDLPTGNFEQMEESIARLSQLPPQVKVYPGHESETTIENERRINPLM